MIGTTIGFLVSIGMEIAIIAIIEKAESEGKRKRNENNS